MSVSSLPEWKQLLLEKKRREEEERGRREKEEEEKLASMPAWKRGIIQRRKAKQEALGDREKERDVCLLQVDARSPSDGLSDTDSSVTINLGSELSLSPDPGLWLDVDLCKPLSQVSLETIVPLHENPFIRTQSAWRKSKDADAGNEPEVHEREKEKSSPRGQDGESGRGREIELKIERFRDLSEGREKDRSRERENSREGWEKEKSQWKELVKDAGREKEVLKVRKEEEEKDTDAPPGSPHVPCLRTIRADNIIIIEQDRTGSDERRGRWREAERERPEDDLQGKRGVKMDLREILAGGGSVTEIRASEVLIIKPPVNPEEKVPANKGRENGEDVRRESVNRELRTDMSWLREKEKVKEKEKPWGQATVIKEDRKDSLDDNVFVERGGRVSQLLSKFGEHPKPPSRSKSSDNFLRPGRRKYSGDEDEQQSEERKADGRSVALKGVPKRSFSFSDRALSAEENGLDPEGHHDRRTRQRIHSDKSAAPWGEASGLEKETKDRVKPVYARDTDRFGKQHYAKGEPVHRRNEADVGFSAQHRQDKRAAEKPADADGDEGFTVASVRNTEGISFARRVPIRQDGKAKTDREQKRLAEKGSERELGKDKDSETRAKTEVHEEGRFESTAPTDAVQKYKHESAFTECSSLLCTVSRDPHGGPEWTATGPQGPYPSVLSQQTEDLISKIEKIGDTTVYSNEKGDRAYEAALEVMQECRQEDYSALSSDSLNHDGTTRSPKKVTPAGVLTGPLEIQIPRTVFYVAEEMAERRKTTCQSVEGQSWEAGRGVEKRDSWRIGKPLSRIESLREKIRQRELERLRQRETRDGSEAAELSNAQTSGDRYDERGADAEKEREAAAHAWKRPVGAERAQEDAAAQTTAAAFDVTQEVGVLKTCPQLPVSVSQSQAVTGEEATSRYEAASLDVGSGGSQASEDEDDPRERVEELRRHREEGREEEEKALSEKEVEEFTLPVDPGWSPSSSPPDSTSLAAMSRIYNLENVGSRSGLCVRERKVDIPPVHLAKVRPLVDGKAFTGDDACGVQTIQRQIEQFQLKEQEALKPCSSVNTPLKDRDTKEQQSPRGPLKQQGKGDVKEKEQETLESGPKMSPQRVCSPTPQAKQTITVTASFLRGQSQDASLKPTDGAPTPTSSPSSQSPAPSPSASPSPTPSPVPFSIRSASGGHVKRGATITITPRKPAAAGGAATGPATGSAAAGSAPAKIPPQPAQTPPAVADPARKRYPTVEEIEVIGGYQNLEKSCLIKNRVTPKKVNVCFDDDQLEQVCEYPSETSMLGSTPYPHDPGKVERLQGGDAEEEDGDVEAAAILSKSTRGVGMSSRGLRTILAQYRSQSPSPKLPM